MHAELSVPEKRCIGHGMASYAILLEIMLPCAWSAYLDDNKIEGKI